jgi:peptidyl-prolyl cis-trans isomerase SurA
MTLRTLRTPAAFVLGTLLLATSALAQARATAPESPFGGQTVEEIIARVNDQVISKSDYDRAQKELDAAAREHNASMQEISAAHKDLLRNLIDQQLWLSKGKELGITGETELIKQLDEIRKKYNLETMEDLEKAAKEQGVSFEDFKANIRNGIVTQQVMRDQVGRRVQATPGEVERYYEQHKQEYSRQESVRLSEILVAVSGDDADKLTAAKAKADDLEAKLHAGGDFAQLARNFSEGPTAAEGGELGQFQRGALAKVLEDQTFALKSGEFTGPIRTKQGYVILKVAQHVPGGVPQLKDVQEQVEDAYYMSKMEPAIRAYLTQMREEAFIDIKPGYADSGASPKETKPVYSAYTPPSAKKKAKVERTRFRETARTFRQKGPAAGGVEQVSATVPTKGSAAKTKRDEAALKPGRKEKIRYGQAPSKTLPAAAGATKTEDAGGATTQEAANTAEPENPLETTAKPTAKTRFSARAKEAKQPKPQGPQPDKLAPAAPDAADVADRQTQSSPLGLAGDTATKTKKKATTTSDKTRLTKKKKDQPSDAPLGATPVQAPAAQTPPPAPVPQTPEPAKQ